MDFYSFSAKLLNGREVAFSDYRGKVVIVANTASKCSFTPQYAQLEALYRKYKEVGLAVLAFPCNQFAHQEPGDAGSIRSACLLNYGVSFPVFEKTLVNGPDASALFTWLKEEQSGFLGKFIKWNFTKFVIDRSGRPVKRFAPTTNPEQMEAFLLSELNKRAS